MYTLMVCCVFTLQLYIGYQLVEYSINDERSINDQHSINDPPEEITEDEVSTTIIDTKCVRCIHD